MKYELGDVEVHKRSRLPHWHAEHGIYFVTFNLFDAIPRRVRERIREEAERQLRHLTTTRGIPTIAEKRAIEQWTRSKLGEVLDGSYGHCFMRDLRIAELVAGVIQHFDRARYELYAWCVMPNHVHVVLALHEGEKIDRVIQSWKSYSSKKANALLGRAGVFWQEDYFDHTVRDSRELQATIEYVVNNPAKAGLFEWPFVRMYSERVPG